MSETRTYVFDLDGTICHQVPVGVSYETAEPRTDVIEKMRAFWAGGHDIIIFTARGMKSFSGDVKTIENVYRKMTEKWLENNRVPYTTLIFGKPAGDVYVDDKGMRPDELLSTR